MTYDFSKASDDAIRSVLKNVNDTIAVTKDPAVKAAAIEYRDQAQAELDKRSRNQMILFGGLALLAVFALSSPRSSK